MKRMIRLTGINNIEYSDERQLPVYVDASAIIMITLGYTQFPKRSDQEQRNRATAGLWEEVERVTATLSGPAPNMAPSCEEEAQKVTDWANARQAAQDLHAAARLVDHYTNRASYGERIKCTEIALSCGTALEHGVMLSRVWVQETPEQIVDLMDPFARGA